MFHVKHFGTIGKAERSEGFRAEFNADSSRLEASTYNATGSVTCRGRRGCGDKALQQKRINRERTDRGAPCD
jgi:hypothetical protein